MGYINLQTPFSKHQVEWLSAWNPCVWQYERQDVALTNTQTFDTGGGVFITRIFMGIGNEDPNAKARDAVFIRIAGTFYDEGKSLKIRQIGAGFVDLEPYVEQFIADESGGYANWVGTRVGWRLELRIFDALAQPADQIKAVVAYHTAVGAIIVADIREFLQAELALRLKNDFGWGYGQVNLPDTGRDVRFEVEARETYIDRASSNGDRIEGAYSEAENVTYYATRSGQDIGSAYNHMNEYYLDDLYKGEFLSLGIERRIPFTEEPPKKTIKAWIDLPFSTSFIYNYTNRPASPDIEIFNPATLERKLDFFDVNGLLIGQDTDALVYSGAAEAHINHIGLHGASSLSSIDHIDLWIEDNEGATPPATYTVNVDPLYVLAGYWDIP
jgi:hypothetical protein